MNGPHYLSEKGAIAWDERARRLPDRGAAHACRRSRPGCESGAAAERWRLCGIKAFFTRNARLDAQAQAVIATLSDIPVNIQPVYPDKI
jgi:hypothetical protein